MGIKYWVAEKWENLICWFEVELTHWLRVALDKMERTSDKKSQVLQNPMMEEALRKAPEIGYYGVRLDKLTRLEAIAVAAYAADELQMLEEQIENGEIECLRCREREL